MADVDQLAEQMNDQIDKVGCDSSLLSQEESVDFYQQIASHARGWAEQIQRDIDAD